MKTCETCQQSFEIHDEDRVFYELFEVPEPMDCPKCRATRRLAERNAKYLSYRKCDGSGELLISQYDEYAPFPVYNNTLWWSDDWDPLSYGRDYDFGQPFFEQFYELWQSVPRMALFVTGGTMENSDYVNCAGYMKNSYLVGEADYDEDCYYSNRVFHSKNIVDCSTSYNNEICYECIECMNCQRLFYSRDCRQCHDSYFLENCTACSDCIGCINQKHKQYMIFNQQYSKEEYEQHKAAFQLDTLEGVQRLRVQCEAYFQTQVHPNLIEEQNENCLGDHLFNSKNSTACFECKDLEDCRYCLRLFGGVKTCMDYTSWGDKAELIYECISCGDNVYNLKFCANCIMNCSNLDYCQHMMSSSDCFGCVGLRRKRFCIFNKQYSEEEYLILKPKIMDHMRKTGEYGRFFPKKFASHGYSSTLAMDEFPMEKEKALAQGYHWVDPSPIPTRETIGELLNCSTCGKTYKYISQELAFYDQYKIPHPKTCPLCRHRNRQDRKNPIVLWERHCGKCHQAMQTTRSPERPEPVYCKSCYLSEIY